MNLYLHDDRTDDPITGNMRAPTHAGTIRFIADAEYQLEMRLDGIAADYPHIVRVESSDGRWWRREGRRFVSEQGAGEAKGG
jgi:hypothetical protein